jgi:hypothetical protein
MLPHPLKTAVLFIVFNRPRQTADVFEAIRQAKPPRLFVASDGPRDAIEGEIERVALVRSIATSVDWPCEVHTLFQHKNEGCQFGPRKGIDWFFQHETCGIILEDDCLPSQSFFWFCEILLERFRHDESVMAITGTNITRGLDFDGDFFFSHYALMWGWATWRRAWQKYDPELSDWGTLRNTRWLRNLSLGGTPFVSTWRSIFDKTKELGANATWWDYQWIYTCWMNKGLTIAPSRNLIRNIGYCADATHTVVKHSVLSNLQLRELSWPLKEPQVGKPHSEADAFISEHWFGVGWKPLIISHIQSMPGLIKLKKLLKSIFGHLLS